MAKESKEAKESASYATLKARAEAGDTDAMFEFAIACLRPAPGLGAPEEMQGWVEAKKWFEQFAKAAQADKKNSAAANYFLDRSEKNLAALKEAAEDGDKYAQYTMGLYREREPDEDTSARSYYRAAAEQGYADAQYQLAANLARGDNAQIKLERFEWLEKAALQGHSYAQVDLGEWYRQRVNNLRIIVSKDLIKRDVENLNQAIFWLEKAAQQKDSSFQSAIGSLYEIYFLPSLPQVMNRTKALILWRQLEKFTDMSLRDFFEDALLERLLPEGTAEPEISSSFKDMFANSKKTPLDRLAAMILWMKRADPQKYIRPEFEQRLLVGISSLHDFWCHRNAFMGGPNLTVTASVSNYSRLRQEALVVAAAILTEDQEAVQGTLILDNSLTAEDIRWLYALIPVKCQQLNLSGDLFHFQIDSEEWGARQRWGIDKSVRIQKCREWLAAIPPNVTRIDLSQTDFDRLSVDDAVDLLLKAFNVEDRDQQLTIVLKDNERGRKILDEIHKFMGAPDKRYEKSKTSNDSVVALLHQFGVADRGAAALIAHKADLLTIELAQPPRQAEKKQEVAQSNDVEVVVDQPAVDWNDLGSAPAADGKARKPIPLPSQSGSHSTFFAGSFDRKDSVSPSALPSSSSDKKMDSFGEEPKGPAHK